MSFGISQMVTYSVFRGSNNKTYLKMIKKAMALSHFILNFGTEKFKNLKKLIKKLDWLPTGAWVTPGKVLVKNPTHDLLYERSPSQSIVLKVLWRKWSSSTFWKDRLRKIFLATVSTLSNGITSSLLPWYIQTGTDISFSYWSISAIKFMAGANRTSFSTLDSFSMAKIVPINPPKLEPTSLIPVLPERISPSFSMRSGRPPLKLGMIISGYFSWKKTDLVPLLLLSNPWIKILKPIVFCVLCPLITSLNVSSHVYQASNYFTWFAGLLNSGSWLWDFVCWN